LPGRSGGRGEFTSADDYVFANRLGRRLDGPQGSRPFATSATAHPALIP